VQSDGYWKLVNSPNGGLTVPTQAWVIPPYTLPTVGPIWDTLTDSEWISAYKDAALTMNNLPGSGASATATVSGGHVTGIQINPGGGGSGYTSAPTVSFFSDTGGSGAAATATISGGQVTGIQINPGGSGSGYTYPPTVYLSGSGASATAIVSNGQQVVGVTINPGGGGSGYTSAPTVSFAGGGGSGALAYINPINGISPNDAITDVNVNNPGSGYTSAPTVYFSNAPYSFQKSFCTSASINTIQIDLKMLVDNEAWVYFDGILIGEQNADTPSSFHTSSPNTPSLPACNITYTANNIAAGTHYLRVDVRNISGTAMGLDIQGTATVTDPQGASLFLRADCCNPAGEIWGRKTNDINNNGINDNTTANPNIEPGLQGWTIVVKNSSGVVVGTATTDAMGYYYFMNLPPGTYTVCEQAQSGWVQTMPGNPTCYQVILSAGQVFEADFGNYYSGGGPTTVTTIPPPLTCTTTTTSLSADTITLGSSVIDTATVNPSSATGTVTFYWSNDGGANWHSYSTKTLSGGSATSDPYTPLAAGNYLFMAVYGGDINYSSSLSAINAEPLTVGTTTTSGVTKTQTNTQLSASTINLGSSVTDTATVYPSSATGTVTFYFSPDGINWYIYGTTKTLSGGSATSDPFTPPTTGNYFFRAAYSGDNNDVGSQSANNAESLKVVGTTTTTVPVTKSVTRTNLSASIITLGASVTDTVTVSPSSATGTVIFYFSPDGINWYVYGAIKTLSGGSATSDPFTPPTTGNYFFRADYSGDNNDAGSQSANNAEPLTVIPAVTTVTPGK